MSTRSQIRFVQETTYTNDDGTDETVTNAAQVYRHSDGYPDAVIPSLNQLHTLLAETGTQRDPAYVAANYIFLQKMKGMGLYVGEQIGDRPSLDGDDLLAVANDRDVSGLAELDQPHFLLGYGVEEVGDIHGDEEYIYVVDIGSRERFGDGDPPEWTVNVSEHGGFPRWDDQDEDTDAFDVADWQFDGTLDAALEQFTD